MRILIVEDEVLLARHLVKLLEDIRPTARIEGITNSIESTVQWLQSNPPPDLIFMDIELADGQSFVIFDKVQVVSPIIFTTAYDEFALQAFKVNSIDYLLKPIRQAELRRSFGKLDGFQSAVIAPNIEQLVRQLTDAGPKAPRERILVKRGQTMIPIDISAVRIFYSHKTLTYVQTSAGQKFVVNHTLDELEKTLDPKSFFRSNRQSIISINSISIVHTWFNGKLKVELNVPVEEEVVVSREKAGAFREWMGE